MVTKWPGSWLVRLNWGGGSVASPSHSVSLETAWDSGWLLQEQLLLMGVGLGAGRAGALGLAFLLAGPRGLSSSAKQVIMCVLCSLHKGTLGELPRGSASWLI